MESARARAGGPSSSVGLMKTACLMLAIALAANGCALAVKGVEQGELARLREQPEVVAVHYTAPPFLVRTTAPKGGGIGAGLGAAGPLGLLLLPLAIGISVAVTAAEEAAERSAGADLTNEVGLEDPVVLLKERLASRLAGEGISRIRPVAAAMDSDDLKRLKQAFGSATVLDVKTKGWGLHYHFQDAKTFFALYWVRARLIRLDQGRVVWDAEQRCAAGGDRRHGLPTLEELRANGGALLKTTFAQAAETCVEPLLARFRGEEPTRPVLSPAESADFTLERGTLAEAEARLLGPAGLVAGSRKFDAKLKGVTLTAQDLPRLRTLLKEATAAPPGSEVQVRGTIDGAPFKAKMDKGSSGRSEFAFEGLAFADEAQASAFLAPLQGRGVRELKLAGVAGGRRINLKLTPATMSILPSLLPADPRTEAGDAGKEPPGAERSSPVGHRHGLLRPPLPEAQPHLDHPAPGDRRVGRRDPGVVGVAGGVQAVGFGGSVIVGINLIGLRASGSSQTSASPTATGSS